MKRPLAGGLILAILLSAAAPLAPLLNAHEGGTKNTKPTKAQPHIGKASELLKAAKKKLTKDGKYSCCVRPSCDLCARTNGACGCKQTAAAGLGVCGECLGGWKAGRGAVRGVKEKDVKLLPARKQKPPAEDSLLAELKEERAELLHCKRILAGEKRYSCCVRGGCGQCALEAECPCGSDLAQTTSAAKGKPVYQGVCGECYDGWHAKQGLFAGIKLDEVQLAAMEMPESAMGPATSESSGRFASGTGIVPRAAPLYMLHQRIHGWSVMLSGQIFTVHTNQTGPRGRDKWFAPNWVMPMASRRLGPGTLTIRSMFSLDPITISRKRYPLLFQSGETANNIPILNGQHPHDFVIELGASYQIRLGETTTINFYGGPRGEPAIGPPAFPHRISASENPVAVLSHHYQDSTHISNNVVTVGLAHGPLLIEASGFHGREPDEKRWGLEGGAIDSLAGRVSFSPTPRWTAQFSLGRINNREATHPVRDSFRHSASLTYVRPLSRGHWASALIWGRNHDLAFTQQPIAGLVPVTASAVSAKASAEPPRNYHIVQVPTRIPGQIYNSYTAESTALFKGRNWIWGRAELVDRDSLLLYEEAPFVRLVEEQRFTRVRAYTAGYERELPSPAGWLSTGLGGQFTIFDSPPNLAPIYGEYPLGIQVFLRLRLGGQR